MMEINTYQYFQVHTFGCCYQAKTCSGDKEYQSISQFNISMEGEKTKKTAEEKYSSSGLRLCNKWYSYSEDKIIKHTNYNVVCFDFFKSIFLPNYKPVLEGPHMQTIQVFHADKNPFLGLEHWEVCLCCFLKCRTILQR